MSPLPAPPLLPCNQPSSSSKGRMKGIESKGRMKRLEDLMRTLTIMSSSTCDSAAALKETEETKRSWTRRRRGARLPSHILLNVEAVVGLHENRTTATAFNRNRNFIQVTFLLKRPPQPSIVYVASGELNPFVGPVVLCSTDNLLLLRVNVGRNDAHLSFKHHHDYYVYSADDAYPFLHLLESPPDPVFDREDVALLPRPDGCYTVAALMDIGRNDVYLLQVYHSETRTWTTRKLSVEPPQWDPLPERIPRYCGALLRHYTSTVVTIGGKGGTIAWVDLWRSILLCDVLSPNPCLRGVPIPLPSTQMSLNGGSGVILDFGGHNRGISYNRDKGCLMLVHLERDEYPPPIDAAARGLHGEVKVRDWVVTTWSNSKMSDSLDDWHEERSVQASKITIDARVLEGSAGLLRSRSPSREHGISDDDAQAAQQQLELPNLSVCQPTLCPNGRDDVVYLVAREKYLHPKAWFLAVDMKDQGTLKDVAYIGNQRHPFCHRIYCLSRISKFTNPKKMRLKSSATDPVSVDEEGSNYQTRVLHQEGSYLCLGQMLEWAALQSSDGGNNGDIDGTETKEKGLIPSLLSWLERFGRKEMRDVFEIYPQPPVSLLPLSSAPSINGSRLGRPN